jgi:Tfp pilus assembly protein PilF|tara:strand:+ start:18188 stop:18853 length:666 start_codon:yes stop_codon:yes gene_type:complete
MKLIYAACITSTLLLSGCTFVSKTFNSAFEPSFNEKVAISQSMVHQAAILLDENKLEQAKSLLDSAYETFPRQSQLHAKYALYYEKTDNLKLEQLAKSRERSMKAKSDALEKKGFYAMSQMESHTIAKQLFSLSLIYNQENTRTLISIATLGYTTGDTELATASLNILEKIGYQSAEYHMLTYLVAERQANGDVMREAKLALYNGWPSSPQLKLINNKITG